jgi:hypothetical protein
LREVAADPQHLGAEIGVISILHTWGRNLLLHPHIHCAIPAGGLSPDHIHWIRPRYPFFLPVKVLSRVFRGKFLAGLKCLYRSKELLCAGPSAALADPRQFAQLIRRLHRQDWVVYAKPVFGGPMQVLRYLGRYTHRVAISNHRLWAFDGARVTFRWKDYTHDGKWNQMTLTVSEFLRRFFLHVLPKAFVRIRHFGFLANCFRARRLSLCRQLLNRLSCTPVASNLKLHMPPFGIARTSAQPWSCYKDSPLRSYPNAFRSILRRPSTRSALQTCSGTSLYSCARFTPARLFGKLQLHLRTRLHPTRR